MSTFHLLIVYHFLYLPTSETKQFFRFSVVITPSTGRADRTQVHGAPRDAGGPEGSRTGWRGPGHGRPNHSTPLVDRCPWRSCPQGGLSVPDRGRPDGGPRVGTGEAGEGHLPACRTVEKLQRWTLWQGSHVPDRLPGGPGWGGVLHMGPPVKWHNRRTIFHCVWTFQRRLWGKIVFFSKGNHH